MAVTISPAQLDAARRLVSNISGAIEQQGASHATDATVVQVCISDSYAATNSSRLLRVLTGLCVDVSAQGCEIMIDHVSFEHAHTYAYLCIIFILYICIYIL